MRNAIKILIVDDDKASAQALGEATKRLGFKPVVVHRPADAMNVVRLQTVHAAVVDVLLPKVTGVELVEQFRQTRFGDNPVILISGVFKDKAFAAESIRKTRAVEFLFKPIELEETMALLAKLLQPFISTEKWSVQSLLTRKLSSDRERAKAIENLEQIKGLDFPFVLSILMDVGSSGHLNIVSDAGEIFGVNLNKGMITDVDSVDSHANGVMNLISNGYLNQDDWDNVQAEGSKRFSLDKLIEQGYVSPHAVALAKRNQIIEDFRSICSTKALQVNFVPQEESAEPPKHAVTLHQLLNIFAESADDFFRAEFLEQFYESVLSSPMRMVREASDFSAVWTNSAFSDLDFLRHSIESAETMEQTLKAKPEFKTRIYQAIHFVVLSRMVMFDDVNRAKSLNTMLDRYKKLYAELKDKSPDQVFEYFGANNNASISSVQNIFEEYSKSNDPEQLGKDATPELKDLCRKCFEIVNMAREIMTDPQKREGLQQKLKAQAAEKQQAALVLVNTAFDMLRQGKAKDALVKLKEAEAMHPTPRGTLISVWAEAKSGAPKSRLAEMQRRLESMPAEERRSAIYFMALGLVKRGQGDIAAAAQFERALQINPDFVEARRELNSLQKTDANTEKSKKLDIFTGDITAVVSNLFRRKAE